MHRMATLLLPQSANGTFGHGVLGLTKEVPFLHLGSVQKLPNHGIHILRSCRKQLVIAKDARRVDVLCERLSLSDKILKGTENYKELHNIVKAAVKKLKKEVGSLDKVSAVAARGIVNRLACGSEIQKLCSFAVESIDSMLSIPGPQTFCILFEDISPTSVVVSLHSRDEAFDESIIGCTIWHRSFEAMDYSDEPTCIILRPDTRIMISGLIPSTEYFFRAAPFSNTKEFGRWESRCFTQDPNGTRGKVPDLNYISLSLKKEQENGNNQTSSKRTLKETLRTRVMSMG
ncbi:hypothetical protein HPP92_012732 [Vanilla planifolia]|uniref:Fibronectin type-III domain-containing protein n=1 Tax=Vanilla planifolia TaxID=51239 RepID=A0A835UY38_VANPL|nr:hypothetical protein HPP92_012732 [Vanilla planifolia]